MHSRVENLILYDTFRVYVVWYKRKMFPYAVYLENCTLNETKNQRIERFCDSSDI